MARCIPLSYVCVRDVAEGLAKLLLSHRVNIEIYMTLFVCLFEKKGILRLKTFENGFSSELCHRLSYGTFLYACKELVNVHWTGTALAA